MAAMVVAPALAKAGLPQAATATAVAGQAMDGYSQLRSHPPNRIDEIEVRWLPELLPLSSTTKVWSVKSVNFCSHFPTYSVLLIR